MKNSQIFTHKGWFGLAPVYLSNVDSERICMVARYNWLEWLIDVSNFIYRLMGAEMFPIKITGAMKSPITIEA